MRKNKRIISLVLSVIMLICIESTSAAMYGATMPSCTSLKVSNITKESARVDFTIKNPSKLTIKTCGMQIRKKGASSWNTKSETVTSSYQKKTSIPVWYTVGKGKEFNVTLSAGTKYEYRGYCKYNGKTYYSSTQSFSTLSKNTMPSCTSLKASNITTNSARVDFTIKNPSCLTVKTCGMQIRKTGASSWSTKSETVTSSYQKKNSIPVWYTVGSGKEFNYTLSQNTSYEYRGYCKYNDKYYYTSIGTFKTSSPAPSGSISSDKLTALKKKYPEGSKWDQSNKAFGGQGCYAYAMTAFNFVYSKTASQKNTNLNGDSAWNNIKHGDVVHYYYNSEGKKCQHWVFVTSKSSDSIVVAEGAYAESYVHYGRKISKSTFTNKKYYDIEIRR